MAATLKDIAERVNVSIVTVSKVLNGTGNFSDDTKKKVFGMARELKYRPNAQARAMRSGKTGNVGFVYSSEGMGHGLPWDFLSGMNLALSELNLNLMVGEVPNERLVESGNLSGLLRTWAADGLLVFNQVELPDNVNELLEEEHVPAVWINRKQKYNSVYFDDFKGAKMAVGHFAALGHTRIAYMDHSHVADSFDQPVHYSQQERLAGYQEAMEFLGLEPVICLPKKKGTALQRKELYMEWLGAPLKPTAVLNYSRTNSFFYAAAALGLGIPRDVSLLSFTDNQDAINDVVPGVLRTAYDELALESVKLLAKRLENPDIGLPSVCIPLKLEPGDTCAPPPA
jgi:LacI family transcriptional regulator